MAKLSSLTLTLASSIVAAFTALVPTNAGAQPTFTITKLISNQEGVAQNTDPNLVNAWGIAHSATGPLWINDNGTGLSTVYDRTTGQSLGLAVTIPGGDPTGIAFVPQHDNDSDDFIIHENGIRGKSAFIFVTESGLISGWNHNVDPNHAIVAVDLSKQHASLKGATIADKSQTLYVADFHNNLVRAFDDRFKQFKAFTDPALPPRFSPFNVEVIQNLVFVAFAERERHGNDEVDGPGLGYVDIFSRHGVLLKRLIANGPLNAPWGMTIAPPGFGGLDGDLLVGNFGDGKINAFNVSTGEFLGALKGTDNQDLVIDGLWGLEHNLNGFLEFTAGPNDEANGLMGTINPSGGKLHR
jgi:uncharacterized protein (TIGR03118 family)